MYIIYIIYTLYIPFGEDNGINVQVPCSMMLYKIREYHITIASYSTAVCMVMCV